MGSMTVSEARAALPELLSRVEEGEEITITRHGRTVAVLVRPEFTVAQLVAELRWPSPRPTVRWVETVGGVRSPIAFDGDSADLCAALDPDLVVLVADAGLGTINAVRLSATSLAPLPVVVYLNHWDGAQLHELNRAWLADRDGFEVIVDAKALAQRVLPFSRQ